MDSQHEAGPEFEVWNHLESGLQLARNELEVLSEEDQLLLDLVGQVVFVVRTGLSVSSEARDAIERVTDNLRAPWLRHALDLRLAEEAVGRASDGFGRFRELAPALMAMPLPEKVSGYASQAAQLYVFGFDGPCIAFCGATLEHALKASLVSAGHTTDEELRTKRTTAGPLLDLARTHHIVERSSRSASRVLRARDRAMHRNLWESRIIRTMALESLTSLVDVLSELGGSNPSARGPA